VEQAGALAELFAGQWSLLPGRRRANACDLIKFMKRYSADTALWEQLCVVSTPIACSGQKARLHDIQFGCTWLIGCF